MLHKKIQIIPQNNKESAKPYIKVSHVCDMLSVNKLTS